MRAAVLNRLGSTALASVIARLRGNTRISVIFEIFFGVANTMYTFYLSLYILGRGVTGKEIGYITAIGYLSGILCALCANLVVDRLGRKRSTTIFELIAWPLQCVIFLFAHSFWLFALGKAVNGFSQISNLSWNFMVVEDADDEQRTAAYNLLTMLHTAVGVITPLGGVLVAQMGIVASEKIFLVLAVVIFSSEMLLRHHFYTETRVGQQIMEQRKTLAKTERGPENPLTGFGMIFSDKIIRTAILLNVVFNMVIPLTSHLSLYLNVYLTDYLCIGSASVSAVGCFNALGLILTGMFVIPRLSRLTRETGGMCRALACGFAVQLTYAAVMLALPCGRLWGACAAAVVYSSGYAVNKTYLDTLVANVTERRALGRSKIYAMMSVMINVMSMAASMLSGFLYTAGPCNIFYLTCILLGACLCVVVRLLYILKNDGAFHKELKESVYDGKC